MLVFCALSEFLLEDPLSRTRSCRKTSYCAVLFMKGEKEGTHIFQEQADAVRSPCWQNTNHDCTGTPPCSNRSSFEARTIFR